MNPFNIDLKKFILLLVVLSLPLISINMEQKQRDETEWYSRPFAMLASLSQEVFYGFSEGVRGTTSLYLNLINIKKQSQDVQNKNNELSARLEMMQELQAENDRLRQALDFKQSTKMELVAAQVIGRDLVPDHSTLTINKGTQHGLKAGQAVMTVNGALGYIFRPQALTSHIMLITDRYAVVDGIVQRTRAHGIVEGKAQNACSLKYVERTEDVQSGDLVVTGGLDNIFPKGLPVATVDGVERKTYSVSLKVDLKPIVDPNKVEEVFVILNAANEDLSHRFVETKPDGSGPSSTGTTPAPSASSNPAALTPGAPSVATSPTGTPTSGPSGVLKIPPTNTVTASANDKHAAKNERKPTPKPAEAKPGATQEAKPQPTPPSSHQ